MEETAGFVSNICTTEVVRITGLVLQKLNIKSVSASLPTDQRDFFFTAVRPEKVSSSSTRTCQLPASCFSCPRFSSTFCTLCLTQWAVPHIRYCSPFHFCTSEVDPGCAGTTLDHGATSIGLFSVTDNQRVRRHSARTH